MTYFYNSFEISIRALAVQAAIYKSPTIVDRAVTNRPSLVFPRHPAPKITPAFSKPSG
jgi:hypothetical protein